MREAAHRFLSSSVLRSTRPLEAGVVMSSTLPLWLYPFPKLEAHSRHAPLIALMQQCRLLISAEQDGFLPDSAQLRHGEHLRHCGGSAFANMAVLLRRLASLSGFSVSHRLGSNGAFNGNGGGAFGPANLVVA